MRLYNKLLALVALTVLTTTSARAQTISNETPISFGQMVVGGTGSVTIPSNSDTRNATGSVALVGVALVQRGYADITYTPGAQVIISFPGTIVMSGANTPTLTPTLEGTAVQTIPVGGVLRIYFGGTINFTTFGTSGTASVLIPITVDPN